MIRAKYALLLIALFQPAYISSELQEKEPSLQITCVEIHQQNQMQNNSEIPFNQNCSLCLFPLDYFEARRATFLDCDIKDPSYLLNKLVHADNTTDKSWEGDPSSKAHWCCSHTNASIYPTDENVHIDVSLDYDQYDRDQNTSLDCFESLGVRCSEPNTTSLFVMYWEHTKQTLLVALPSTTSLKNDTEEVAQNGSVLNILNETSLSTVIDEDPSIPSRCHANTIRKCCPESSIYDYNEASCISEEDFRWRPFMNNSVELQPNVSILYGFPDCVFYALQPSLNPNHSFSTNADGTVYVPRYQKSYTCDSICLDFFRHSNKTEEEALLCFPKEDDNCSFLKSRLYPTFLIVSTFFLTLTIIVYSVLSELNSKLNGKCVILSTSTLLLGYICFIIMAWSNSPTKLYCPVLGLFAQFFLLSSFFWLNVMCFDVWRAFRVPRWEAGHSRPKTARLIKYCLYAWGCPLLISAITGFIHFLYPQGGGATGGSGVVLPGFGSPGCFFSKGDPRSWWAYFYGFISVLLALDLLFFAHLLILLQREKRATAQAAVTTSPRNAIWVKLYFKLFIVMGVPWIFEVVSWVEGSCNIWIWADSFNALRGLLIFVIFVCKKSIFKKLKDQNLVLTSFKSSTKQQNPKQKSNSKFYVDLEV